MLDVCLSGVNVAFLNKEVPFNTGGRIGKIEARGGDIFWGTRRKEGRLIFVHAPLANIFNKYYKKAYFIKKTIEFGYVKYELFFLHAQMGLIFFTSMQTGEGKYCLSH